MSIFLSGNNVASQPYIVKINDTTKPPTDLSLPIGVDYLLPENGGAAVGSIKNIGTHTAILHVVLAGEGDLNNQVTYTLNAGDTLDAQIRYISPASTYDLDPITKLGNTGVLAMSVSLSSTSTITAPYYNFIAKADWYQVFDNFGGDPNDQADFENWINSELGMYVMTLSGYTYVETTEISEWGNPIGTISCNLDYDGKDKKYILNEFFYEINGIGRNFGDRTGQLLIQYNNNLTYVSNYYGNIYSSQILFQDNPELEYIDGSIFNETINNPATTFLQISGNYNLKGIQNFVSFPSGLVTMYCYNNGQYLGDDSRGSAIYRNLLRWDYDMRNLINLATCYLSSNGLDYFDYSLLPETTGGDLYLNLSENNLTEFSPVAQNLDGSYGIPDGIDQIDLGYNKISIFKPEYLPKNITYFGLYYNQLSDISVEFDWATMCPYLNYLDLGYNYISKLSNPLLMSTLELRNNLLYDWDNYVLYTKPNQTNIVLSFNKFTTLPNNLPYPNLQFISLDSNELTSVSSDLTTYPLLQGLRIDNNKITGELTLNASSSLYNFVFNRNPITSLNVIGTYPTIDSLNFDGTNVTSISGNYATKFPSLQYIHLWDCGALITFNATFSSALIQISINNSGLTTFNPVCPGVQQVFVTNTSLENLNWTFPTIAGFGSFNFTNNAILKSVTTNNLFDIGVLAFGGCPLLSSVNFGTGNKFPYYIDLANCGMTTASWTAMNTWATGLSTWSGRSFYAYNNVNTITGTTTATTLASKSINVYP